MNKKVTIITPIYNNEQYLGECINSIINQTYENLQIILVDDGSTDGSGDICDAYASKDSRIVVYHQQNRGVVTARNVGIENAAGEFIAFVDSDDTIEPHFVEFLLNYIGDCDCISAGIAQELKSGSILKRHDNYAEGIYKNEKYQDIVSAMLCFEEVTYIQYVIPFIVNKLYRTRHLKRIYTKLPTDLTFAEDIVFTCANLLNCKSMVVSHECLYHYRYRETSAVHQINKKRLIEINKTYLALYDILSSSEYKDRLLLQLERWVTVRTYRAINYQMGFSGRGTFRDFEIDMNGLEDKKIVLYGAGKAGCDYYRQLSNAGIEVVCWVDKRYQELRKQGLNVCGIEEIGRAAFDLVLIAVSKSEQAQEIAEELERAQIAKEKMLWRMPRRVIY